MCAARAYTCEPYYVQYVLCHVGDIFVHLGGVDVCDESQWN